MSRHPEYPHGYLGNPSWPHATLVAECDQDARPGYMSKSAHEFQDSTEVLKAKVTLLAEMLKGVKKDQSTLVYTGAGISTAAGIGDYASKAKGSRSGAERHSMNRLKAQPTYTHHVLTALEKRGLIHEWINQNHDGLAQKAGYPISKLNEIHGSWFDRKNRVRQMDESLDPKLFERMIQWGEKSVLTLTLGSSLAGMNADQVCEVVAEKHQQSVAQHTSTSAESSDAIVGQETSPSAIDTTTTTTTTSLLADRPAGGLVVINLQETRLDDRCALRIYGTLDQVMGLLARKLKLKVGGRCLEQKDWIK